MMRLPARIACATVLILAGPSFAQNPPSPDPPSTLSLKTPGCPAASATPATDPAPASRDGTAPGNAGSTGWSGGLGGSNIGTSQNGALPESKSFQPATASGLDPIAAPRTSADKC